MVTYRIFRLVETVKHFLIALLRPKLEEPGSTGSTCFYYIYTVTTKASSVAHSLTLSNVDLG